MRNKFLALLAATAALVLAGCIDMTTVVHVAPDGSGVVEERVLMKKELAEMMQSMGQAMGAEEAQSGASPLLDPEKLAAAAEEMGPGVALVSAEPLETDKGLGYVAKYSFKDINQLALNQNPGDRAPSDEGPANEQKDEPIRFVFEPGPEPVLIIRPPRPDESADDEGEDGGEGDDVAETGEAGEAAPAEEGAAGEDPAESQMAMMMMQQMFDGLRIEVRIETETPILETNAAFRDGNTVTLMSMDFGKLLADPEKLKAFADSGADSVEMAKQMMQDIPGIEVDLSPEIRIRMAGKGAAEAPAEQPAQ